MKESKSRSSLLFLVISFLFLPMILISFVTLSYSAETQLSAGDYHTVGLKPDGKVLAVGSNYFDQCKVGFWTGIVQVDGVYIPTVGLK